MKMMKERQKVFGLWFIIFLLWALYRANFFLSEWIDELLVKPLVFVLPVVWLTIIWEKKGWSELGFSAEKKEIVLDFFLGVLVGILFAFEGLFVNSLKYGRLVFAPISALRVSGGVLPFLFLNFTTSFWEEILGRGFLYQRLYRLSQKKFQAAFLSSFLFLLLHFPIMFTRLHLRGFSFFIYPFSIFILGVVNCYFLSLRKSLTLPILLHTFWNMTVALYL